MAAQWEYFDPSKIFPDRLGPVLDTVLDTAEVLADSIETISGVVKIAATFTSELADLQEALIDKTREVIHSAVQQLTQTGVYALWHLPSAHTQAMPPSKWLSDVANSFDDEFDAARPMMPQKGFVGAVILLSTGPSLPELLEKFRALAVLFNKLIASKEQVKRWPMPGEEFVVRPGDAKAPNWSSQKTGDLIPPMGDLGRILLRFAETITAARRGHLSNFADFLEAKARYLEDIAAKIREILDMLRDMLDIQGIWALPIYGEFNKEELQSIITSTPDGPNSVPRARYTAGAMFLATGGTSADVLFELFGLAKEITQISRLENPLEITGGVEGGPS